MSAERVPYRDTVRIIVPESRRGVVTRGFVLQRIIKGLLKMEAGNVLACQHFQAQGFFDVTFMSTELFRLAQSKLKKEYRSEVLQGLDLRFSPLEFTVVVHVFNPFVEEADIRLFLSGRAVKVRGGEKMLEDGVWNGKRRYRLELGTNAEGALKMPPRVFALGANKGRLFIPAIPQSQTCWACREPGHTSRECSVLRCLYCMGEGHVAKDCKKEKVCNLCLVKGHLFNACPKRARSYAGVVARGSGGTGAPASAGGSPVPKKGTGEGVVDMLKVGKGSSVSAAHVSSRPHGRQDGGELERNGDKGTGKTAAPEDRLGDEWGDHSSSQEAEMAEAVGQAMKRPREDGGDREERSPPAHPAGQEGDSEEDIGESDESEEREDSESSVDSGGALSPPPGKMPGWEEDKLMQTMGMAPPPPPKGEPP